jgi:hypothetical protein
MNYKNGKIYKITSDSTNKIYIGSTCQPLSKRIANHRDTYKSFINGKYHKITSFELIKLEDAIITLIEDFPCERKEQLQARERYHIELNKDICINKYIPTRTLKEYYQTNKDIINATSLERYYNNKELRATQMKEYYIKNRDSILEKKKNKKLIINQ